MGEKRIRKTLGRYPDLPLAEARKQAKQLISAAALGEGVFAPQAQAVLFEEAKARFLKDCEGRNKPRTVADYKRLLNKHFTFKSNLDAIDRQKVMKVISGLSSTPSEQSHAYVAIRTMMNWCVRHGLIETSVVPKIKQNTKQRNHVLCDDELREVYLHALEAPFPFGAIIQLLILTGQRRTEISSLRRSWIFGDTISYPEGFTKNKREHRLPLSPLAQQVIGRLPDTGDLLFSSANDFEKPFTTWAWNKARFDEGLEGVEHYTIHDLRRTFSTIHAKIGTPIHVTEKLLNHVSGTISGVAAIYNRHSYMDEMREAVDRYDEYLTDLIS